MEREKLNRKVKSVSVKELKKQVCFLVFVGSGQSGKYQATLLTQKKIWNIQGSFVILQIILWFCVVSYAVKGSFKADNVWRFFCESIFISHFKIFLRNLFFVKLHSTVYMCACYE